ncbi:aspartic proteinase [Abortiporus biennis]|nr:aspartic proteinase [Abortiporus biennis]
MIINSNVITIALFLTTSVLALSSSSSPIITHNDKKVVIENSPITLPFARRLNTTRLRGGNLLKNDLARAKHFKTRAATRKSKEGLEKRKTSALSAAIGVPATNQAVDYVLTVGVGSPVTNYSLLVDTGSSNTWVGAHTLYRRTSTSAATVNAVFVEYGSGFFFGQEFTDRVTLAPGLVIEGQSIGVTTPASAFGFDGVDGIIGIGPQDLTCGTLTPQVDECIPTVTDNAFSQNLISSDLVGISFQPATSTSDMNGELTFGGTDSSKFTGDITFVPITSTSPASEFVGLDQSITYGSANTPILATTAGIMDTGTTLLMIATDAFQAYQTATGAVPDSNTGLLTVTADQFASLESLFFTIGDTTFEFTPNAQLWPRALNTAIGGTTDGLYLIVNDIGSASGEGLDFIDGLAFLERFYTVYDTAGSRFGIATTSFTDAETN